MQILILIKKCNSWLWREQTQYVIELFAQAKSTNDYN